MQLSKSHTVPYTLPVLDETFWAYLAGLVDGEAHIRRYFVRKTSIGNNYGYEMCIAQNRENGGKEIFEWLQKKLGVGRIRRRKLEKPEKDVFYFTIAQRIALEAIWRKILPFTHIKTGKIKEMLNYIERVYGQVVKHG